MTKIVHTKPKSKKPEEKQFKNRFLDEKKQFDKTVFSPPLFNTLAQLCTDSPTKPPETLTRRAKAKFITNGLIFPLIDLNSPLKNSYWRTWHCTSVLLQEGHKLTSKYCNNRWCIVCNRIRTAKMINKYYPVIKSELPDLHFTTLTFPNVKGEDLEQAISDMISNFQRIKNKMRMRDKIKIKGIRKLECTVNYRRRDFNPHLHFLMDGRGPAELLQKEWLLRYPQAYHKAQKILKADDGSIIELLKYTTKLVHKDDYTKLDNNQIQIGIHPEELDTIFQAVRNRRTYQPFGIKLNLNEDVEELKSEVYEEILSDIDVWKWDQDNSDWVSTYGELLTGCDAHKIYQVVQAK